MDYMGGGELFTHLLTQKMLREDAVRVYAAEMILAIEYLHNMDIIHRYAGVVWICLDVQNARLRDLQRSEAGERLVGQRRSYSID